MSSFFRPCFYATLGPIGYLPAPGTLATLMTLPVVYYFRSALSIHIYMAVVTVVAVVSFFIIKNSLGTLGNRHDPSEIILDEVVGTFVAFIAVPVTPMHILFGFFLFRLFDITKIFGIRNIENLGGAWGILFDDIAAGVVTTLIVCLAWKKFGV